MKKNNLIFIISIIIIFILFIGITYYKNSDSSKISSEVAECIANKSILYISSTCGHCSHQEDILGDYKKEFNIVNCALDPKKCSEDGINSVPTWIINNKKYIGVKDWSELRKITNC